ncbi:MAG: hypothetical protein ACKOC5_14060 [Chloroflexota bacterium]
MKKASLLILLVIVLSAVLTAAVPIKMLRLTIINKSDYDVYVQLEGSSVSEAFYYLTVPTGSRDEPTVKLFTVLSDVYQRTTWQCDGYKSSGTLAMLSNLRLTFTPCFERKYIIQWHHTYLGWDEGWLHFYGIGDPRTEYYLNPFSGEPGQEKVTAFRYLAVGAPQWGTSYKYTGYWSWGCVTYYWRSRSWRTPVGCDWFYQY